jgi:hypothetical protein
MVHCSPLQHEKKEENVKSLTAIEIGIVVIIIIVIVVVCEMTHFLSHSKQNHDRLEM